jgi:uncharacterized protein YkwD
MSKTKNTTKKTRYGLHQRRSKKFYEAYLPYLPLLVLFFCSMFLLKTYNSSFVLSYSTEMSVNELLTVTNDYRSRHGSNPLTNHNYLNDAAQAKAIDMANNNYWSHNTPSGEEPWLFITNANYLYLNAGENLAYGFATSRETIAGWINSPTHRENMLDNNYTEVGFGFINSEDYVGNGRQTIVVAMYAKPAPGNTPASMAKSKLAVEDIASSNQMSPLIVDSSNEPDREIYRSSETPDTKEDIKISRIQTLTDGRAPWSIFALGIIIGSGLCFVIVKHGLSIRRAVHTGEEFVLHHIFIDTIIIAIIVLAIILTQTSGIIR